MFTVLKIKIDTFAEYVFIDSYKNIYLTLDININKIYFMKRNFFNE